MFRFAHPTMRKGTPKTFFQASLIDTSNLMSSAARWLFCCLFVFKRGAQWIFPTCRGSEGYSTGLPATILHANHAPFSDGRQGGRRKKILQRSMRRTVKGSAQRPLSQCRRPFDRQRFGRPEGQGYKGKRARPISDSYNFIKRAPRDPRRTD